MYPKATEQGNFKMTLLDRVIFFSKEDLAGTPMLEKAEKLLEKKHDFGQLDLNALLEFHHIHQYFENDKYLDSWTSSQRAAYAAILKNAMTAIRNYMRNMIPAKVMEEAALLEYNNQENFWELIRYFELYKSIDDALFFAILNAHPHHIRYILPLKQIVQHYNLTLRSFLMTSEESAELLLAHYEQKNTTPSNYHFPKSLTDTDKQTIITSYLKSDDPNLNYIELVRNSKNLKLPPKILLKAKQAANKIKEEILNEENSMKMSVGATLDKKQAEPVTYKNEGGDTRVTYGGLFLDSLKTELKLFAVFSQIFLYTDQEGLITLVNKDTEMDVLEKIGMQSKNEYHTSFVFAKKDMLSIAQLGIFDHYLKEKGRSIENLLQNVIKDLFVDHFKVNELSFAMPDPSLSAIGKIRLLAPEMEYLLKQYKDFVTHKQIDHELLQIDSNPVFFSELPSLLPKKYIYSSHESIRVIQYHFYDQNSVFAMRKRSEKPMTLFKRLESGNLGRSDFEDYQLPYLDQAVAAGDLLIDDNGFIGMADPIKVIIAGKLRKNGTISYWHYGEEFRIEVDRLIAEGLLTTSDQLFTIDETSYLNYYLNKKEFTNGKDLRNKYLHGSNIKDEKQQEIDYLYFLRTFIVILLKLKDDLILSQHHSKLTAI
ncbi:hypothetical protein [Mucilaginibacter ginkgonis]|uniref:Uncharacterized protein n=1 Tax=Mucilaginibacter ginkgonis TaxID=2682091 RepID=A0A7T7FBG3_9SPHI|nr:hypothetical protein [Mucilaginibacter ginkgonis]QQL50272.1 hypothetical protein GO620_002115 [Mucilaginibacter ginkgonis]